MKVRPLGDRVLIKPLEEEATSASGIILPDTAKEKPMRGKVVATGNGRVDDRGEVVKMEVKSNDVVLYGKYSGTEIKLDGDDYLIMRESDILAIVD